MPLSKYQAVSLRERMVKAEKGKKKRDPKGKFLPPEDKPTPNPIAKQFAPEIAAWEREEKRVEKEREKFLKLMRQR